MRGLVDLARFIWPPEDPDGIDPNSIEHHRRWRQGMFMFVMAICFGIAYGWFRYVTGAEVDRKIAASAAPITQKLNELAIKAESQSLLLQSSNKLIITKLTADLEKSIVETQIQKCRAKSDVGSDYFRDRLAEFKRQYFDVTQREYRGPPRCEDL